VKFATSIFAACSACSWSGVSRSRLLVVVAGEVRPQDLQSVPDRDARVTTRKASENRLSWALASLLSACQAMSIAMTTVLPEPVAILKAMRYSPGLRARPSSRSLFSIQGWRLPATSARKIAVSRASIWQKNSGFSRSDACQ